MKFNNQYDLIFHLHNEVLDYVYGQKKLEKDVRSQEDTIKRLLEENDKYCYLASNDKDKCRYDIWEEVLDKIQKLKEKYK